MSVSDLVERRRLYEAGLSDHAIAAASGDKRNTIAKWRRANRLPSHVLAATLSDEARARRMLMYQMGWSDHHIAREERVDKSSVQEWRQTHGLRPNFAKGKAERWWPRPTFSDLAKRVRRAIGQYLPRDIADDAASSLVLAVLDGSIDLAEIEAAAKRFGNKALDTYASRFGPRSLDFDNGDGLKMLDIIPDDRSSSWLEEMGATVW